MEAYLSFIYESIDDFFLKNEGKNFAYLSSHGTKDYCSIDYQEDMFLIFGKESKGLPQNIVSENDDSVYNISIYSEHIRSLNLANAVSIVVYEGLRNVKSHVAK